MELYMNVLMFILGAIIGSFLNVVIYRIHTGKSLNGNSHCLSCGTVLRWYELFPLISYIFLRGRCSWCHAYIPVRYWIVEFLTAATFLWLYTLFSETLLLFTFYAVLLSVCIVIAVHDIRHTIIPDELVLTVLGLALFVEGVRLYQGESAVHLAYDVGAGLIAAIFLGFLWYVSRGRWIGLGDAKLALPLGMLVGLGGVFSMLVFSFWIGALISILLLLLQKAMRRGKKRLSFLAEELTIKSEVPFAPFLIAGFVVVELLHANVFEITWLILPFF